jgi:protease-4
MGGLFQFIAGAFRFVWFLIDGARRVVLNLVLLVLVVALIVFLVNPGPIVPNNAALVVHPNGALVEQTSVDPSLAMFSPGNEKQTALSGLIEAVRAARNDSRIKLLVLETDDIAEGGFAKLGELRAAIAEFKASGKPVLARGEQYEQGQYYLASVADEIHLAHNGTVSLPGLASYATYFRGALDKLGVKMHVFRVGEYKSYAEPFTRSDMSDEDREEKLALLGELWERFRNDIIAARKLTPAGFDAYVLHYRDALKAAAGDASKASQTAGLVDRFSTGEQWRARIKERLGDTRKGKDFRSINADAYLAAVHAARTTAPDHIAVLVAQGTIVDGEQSPGNVGSDTLAQQIREVREDDHVKAVVLRIDSPGGSAHASEIIRQELELTRQAGKPVIASMSSMAASGGYWIATAADEIFAEPTTLTGSIGVIAMFPELAEPFARLGLTVDGVATTPLAGALDPRRPLAPETAEIVQLSVEHNYRLFLNLVAQARKMKPEEVDRVARGRIWTGAQAHKLGLVDQMGDLDAALAAAAKRAGLTQYTTTWPTQNILSMQQFLWQAFSTRGEAATAPSPVSRMVSRLAADFRSLSFWNDPYNVYAHCLCETP